MFFSKLKNIPTSKRKISPSDDDFFETPNFVGTNFFIIRNYALEDEKRPALREWAILAMADRDFEYIEKKNDEVEGLFAKYENLQRLDCIIHNCFISQADNLYVQVTSDLGSYWFNAHIISLLRKTLNSDVLISLTPMMLENQYLGFVSGDKLMVVIAPCNIDESYVNSAIWNLEDQKNVDSEEIVDDFVGENQDEQKEE